MILSFKQKFKDGEPTYFIEKIWRALFESTHTEGWTQRYHPLLPDYNEFKYKYACRLNKLWDGFEIVHNPKLHSIREDKHNRWKQGKKIHFYIGSRTKNAFQFAPVVECKGVQNIEIIHTDWQTKIGVFECFSVSVDERILSFEEIDALAKNDGFKSIPDFLSWFNKDFKGKIIHWTDFRY